MNSSEAVTAAPTKRKRVLVAVDHGDCAERIAEFVADFFGALDVEIIAISVGVVRPPAMPAGFGMDGVSWGPSVGAQIVEDEMKSQTEHALHSAEECIAECGLQDDDEIIQLGNPADVIRAAAEERDVDLIVVGASHRKMFKELLSPSVPTRLARGGHVPVLMVP